MISLETCRRCETGNVKVIGAGFQGNTMILNCHNPLCNAVYEIDLYTGRVPDDDYANYRELESESASGF